jgi:hypothetical protein
MSKDGLVGRAEVAQHMLCWQNLLTAQSLELADLINSLDEEAAAEIRKVALSCAPHTQTHEGREPAGTSRLCRITFRFCEGCDPFVRFCGRFDLLCGLTSGLGSSGLSVTAIVFHMNVSDHKKT